MIASLNEIESLVLKAARGAGMTWGVAEEAAVAAAWLAERALPWAETLVGILAQQHATCRPEIVGDAVLPSRAGFPLCPILTGSLLSDLGALTRAIEVRDVLGPLWLAPFVARWAGPDRAVRLRWPQVCLSIDDGGLTSADAAPTSALTAPFANRVEIGLVPIARAVRPLPQRERGGYLVSDVPWSALQGLEHRTYVPASAESRLAGAGAGLLDND
jgi:hypothetical protein